jgi:hypothetical protein
VLAAEFGMESGLANRQKISRDHWSLFHEVYSSESKVLSDLKVIMTSLTGADWKWSLTLHSTRSACRKDVICFTYGRRECFCLFRYEMVHAVN